MQPNMASSVKNPNSSGVIFAPRQDLALIQRTIFRRNELERQLSDASNRLYVTQAEQKRLLWKGRWEGRARKKVKERLNNVALKQNSLKAAIKHAEAKLNINAANAYKHVFDLIREHLPRELRDIVYGYLNPSDDLIGNYTFAPNSPGWLVEPNTSQKLNIMALAEKTPICGDRSAHPDLWREMAEHVFKNVCFEFPSLENLARFLRKTNNYGYGVLPATYICSVEVEIYFDDTLDIMASNFEALTRLEHPNVRVAVKLHSVAEPIMLSFLQRIKPTWDHLKASGVTNITVQHLRQIFLTRSHQEQSMLPVLEGPEEDMEGRLREHYKNFKGDHFEDTNKFDNQSRPCYVLKDARWTRIDSSSKKEGSGVMGCITM
ncbi:hypothetical protein BDV96DRAFT_24540 [Lophiotrema nucula]|uniref:Uncharacterized protein n=1 Tax=Lophiotrema nucula TaxID=690887 RepID=A0A6A5ZG23_9PLEO|nr:hypothetical protein BDV96DRAFT_24540 [Lophiotrema nucula]